MALLEVRALTLRFGGLTAVNRVDFSVEPGQILSVIGPNGAGRRCRAAWERRYWEIGRAGLPLRTAPGGWLLVRAAPPATWTSSPISTCPATPT